MSSSQKPLLLLLLSFLLVMLWQAWVIDHKQDSREVLGVSATPNSQIKEPEIVRAKEVTIETDLLRVSVNKLGATITQVQLKGYPQSTTNAEPFDLFSKQPRHLYTAQAGFGKDHQLEFVTDSSYFKLAQNSDEVVATFTAKQPSGVVYEKTITCKRGSYAIDFKSRVLNQSQSNLVTAHHNRFNLQQDFPIEEKSPSLAIDPNQPKPGWFTFSTYTGPALYTEETPYVKLPFKDIESKGFKKIVTGENWIAMQQRYFITAWVDRSKAEKIVTSNFLSKNSEVLTRKSLWFDNKRPEITLLPGQQAEVLSTLYAGPEIARLLSGLAKGLELTVDYGWLWFLSDILFKVMVFIQKYLRNWGVAIIMTTVLVKLVFYKMSESSYRTIAKQKKLKPRIDAINEQYKDESSLKNQALMKLYQEESINPIRSGCLPTVLPLPFFIALYYVLIESVQLRLAPFLWIPDLASKDPYYILPVLMGVSMLLQQRLSPPQGDPAQEKAMMIVPLMMCFMFSQFPAGLVLYSITNNVLSYLQQYYIMSKYGAFNKKNT